MNPFMSMKYTVALLPALALGISIAAADETKHDRPCDEKQANVQDENDHGQKMAEKRHDQKKAEKASKASERASAVAKTEAAAKAGVHESHFLASKPTGNYFHGDLIGHDVINRRDNKVVGSVDKLLIDQDGQISAVIISTGGFMGMGKKNIAIEWDQVKRKIDGENITLSVEFTDASLVDAPSFASK